MTNTENKTPRITKTMRFEDIAAMLVGESAPNGTTLDDALTFIARERELLANKNKGGDKKPTANQEANEGFKKLIIQFLATLPEDSDGVTCTVLQKSIPEFADFNTSKLAALTRQLKDENRIIRKEVKGKALFSLA